MQVLSATLIIGVMVGSILIPAAGFPASVITVALLASMIAGEISARFKIDKKKHLLKEMIKTLNVLQEKLDYVIQINGDLSSSEYHEIIKQFTTGVQFFKQWDPNYKSENNSGQEPILQIQEYLVCNMKTLPDM